MIFFENRLKFPVWDTDSGVPDLDHQHSVSATAPEQHCAALGVFQCIRKQISDHLLEQTRIAADRQAARDYAQDQSPCLRVIGELIHQSLEQIVDREIDHLGAHHAGLDLVD